MRTEAPYNLRRNQRQLIMGRSKNANDHLGLSSQKLTQHIGVKVRTEAPLYSPKK